MWFSVTTLCLFETENLNRAARESNPIATCKYYFSDT